MPTKGRAVPDDRITALRSADVARVRAWAKRARVELFGDDSLLLWSIHEARSIMPEATDEERAASVAWLDEHPKPAG